MNSLKNSMDLGLLILRVGVGGMFFYVHGLPKILGGPDMWGKIGGAMGKLGINFFPVFWGLMASLAEGLGGLLLVLGVGTRLSSGFLAFTMLIAAIHHLTNGDKLAGSSHAIELGVVFVALMFLGSGKYALKPSA